jgi:hypothetical protein
MKNKAVLWRYLNGSPRNPKHGFPKSIRAKWQALVQSENAAGFDWVCRPLQVSQDSGHGIANIYQKAVNRPLFRQGRHTGLAAA